jgi:hypothetical protein
MNSRSASASARVPMVKYSPRRRNRAGLTTAAKAAANTPDTSIPGTSGRPRLVSSAVVYSPMPMNAAEPSDTSPP